LRLKDIRRKVMFLIRSDKKGDGFGVSIRIHSEDAGGELAAILKTMEREHPNVLAQALDYLMDGAMEVK
jgi:hypothetical protein